METMGVSNGTVLSDKVRSAGVPQNRRARFTSQFFIVMGALITTMVHAQDWAPPPGPQCRGEFSREELTLSQQRDIFANHKNWLSTNSDKMDHPNRANLCEAELEEVSWAGKNLSGADMVRINLQDAVLTDTNLSRANLYGAELHRTDLSDANLTNAVVTNADLAQADLTGADLTGADLSGVDLEGARLARSNLTGAKFAPDRLPGVEAFAGVVGLSQVTMGGKSLSSPMEPLVRMREKFRNAGYRSHAKEMTSAIRKIELHSAAPGDRFFQNFIAGGKLTDFGANAWGALAWLGILLPVFFIPYYIALRLGESKHGIWRCRPKERLLRQSDEHEREVMRCGSLRAIPYAFYFSLLSAFHFGWQQLNLGNWLVRLQAREYTLEATGWVRTIAGLQSLISLYVVALFLVTYFGEPFA